MLKVGQDVDQFFYANFTMKMFCKVHESVVFPIEATTIALDVTTLILVEIKQVKYLWKICLHSHKETVFKN